MKVTVEILTGTFIDTEVNENATVRDLKENIATELKLPVKRLILLVGDDENRRIVMENEDEMMLRDLGVIEDSHMYLFFMHPDLVFEKERSREEEEISSDAENRRGNEEDKANINGHEEEDKAMKIDEKAEGEEEEKEKNGEEKDNDGVKEEAKESEEGDKKVET
ncbi:hypothetical protein V5N11_013898 [Cardamine amara subsp. amara]|uniref:Ubiquitin-like domain-containing protein n=1 Tax=Cardamine amara subsp. amara TaxID=228776 RepID=A0ABD1BDJ1_CARAN